MTEVLNRDRNETLVESVIERLEKNFKKEIVLMNNNSYNVYYDDSLGEYIYIEEFDREITKKDVKHLYTISYKALKDKIWQRYKKLKQGEYLSKQTFIYILIVAPSCEQNVYTYLNRLHSTHNHNFVIPMVYLKHSNEFVRFFKKPHFGGVYSNYIKARIDSIFLGKGYYLEYDLKDISKLAGNLQFYGTLGLLVPAFFVLLLVYMLRYNNYILMFGFGVFPVLIFFGMAKFSMIESSGSIGSSLIYVIILTALVVGFIYFFIASAMSVFTLI